MRIIKRFNYLKLPQKVVCVVFSILLFVSTIVAGTLAWYSFQNELNSFHGFSQPMYSVVLHKYERDVAGNETTNPIENAEFYLFNIDEDGNEHQVGDRLLTDGDGRITLTSTLRPGEYYFLETDPTYAYDFDNDEEGAITKYYFTITGDNIEEEVIIHAYNQRLSADVTITKNVVNYEGSPLTDEQLDTTFGFIVTFDDLGTYRYTIDDGEEQSISSGDRLYLSHGQTATIIGLPVGIQYTVTEEETEHYSVHSHNHQGNLTTEGANVTFNNTYHYRHGSLIIDKQVAGEGADLDKEFSFTIDFSDGESYAYRIDDGEEQWLTSGDSFTLQHNQVATFINLPYGLTYTITENDYREDGYIATTQEVQGEIIRVSESVTFTNVYSQEGAVDGTLTIHKQVIGQQEIDRDMPFIFVVNFSEVGEYTYQLIKEGESIDQSITYRLPEDGRIVLQHGETAVFNNLPEGVSYIVTEIETEGYIGNFKEVRGTIAGDHVTAVNFTNLQHSEEGRHQSIKTLRKIVEGEVPIGEEDKAFEFTIIIDGEETIVRLKHGEEATFDLPYGAVYEVIEKDYTQDGYALVSLENGQGVGSGEDIEVIATNRYMERIDIEVHVTKEWRNTETIELPRSITVHLQNGDQIVETAIITPNEQGQWVHTFVAPKYDAEGNEIEYHVIEEEIDMYEVAMEETENGYRIINTYAPQPMDISVTKVWETNGANRPDSIEVQLYKDGEAYGELVTLDESTNWSYVWSDVSPDARYEVDEPNVPEGYESQVTGDVHNGFVITNTYIVEEESPKEEPNEPTTPEGGGTKPEGGVTNTPTVPPGSTPRTGDVGGMIPWLLMIVISTAVLRYLLFYKNPYKKHIE